MKQSEQKNAIFRTRQKFNFYKLQAVACMASSAAVSIGIMYWAIKSFA